LNITEKLIRNADATYFMTVQGDSLIEIGIQDKDTIVVDRSLHPGDCKLVVASLHGELFAKRMRCRKSTLVTPGE
jgi:DNA polymerase V